MNAASAAERRTQTVVLRLLRAVDQALAANREVAEARAALEKLSCKPLRLVPASVDVGAVNARSGEA
jgi:hypothetical protein